MERKLRKQDRELSRLHRRRVQKVKLLIRNSWPSVKGQLKDLNRRIGKLSLKSRWIS